MIRGSETGSKESFARTFCSERRSGIYALDANQKTRFVFTGLILNVESDNKGNIVGYNVKREITQTLAKPLPKKKPIKNTVGDRRRFNQYEGDEEPSSEEEPFLDENEVVVRRKRKDVPWTGLERGVEDVYNNPEAGDSPLWDRFKIPRGIILTAECGLRRDDAYTETIKQLTPVPDAKASENRQIILAALNNVEISDELKDYWEFRSTALTVNDEVTQDDYGLAIPEGKEKIVALD